MAPAFRYPDKPRRGDAVAVLSPSAGLPARFPLPYELGLTRLREEFGLRPVEYPSTRAAQASPAQRAADIHAAPEKSKKPEAFTAKLGRLGRASIARGL